MVTVGVMVSDTVMVRVGRGRVAYLDQRLNWTAAITGILKSVRPGRTHH